ncbi:MAG: RNA degradosome polyphosphate kinase [Microscillaceae bacterium]
MISKERVSQLIRESNYISRDLSWLRFNLRVLDQAQKPERSVFDQLKFLAITASNLDEFFMIRVGSLYNYLDYGKERIDYSGLREKPFRTVLLHEAHYFFQQQNRLFSEFLGPQFAQNGFLIQNIEDLSPKLQEEASEYFNRTVFPMLTPMVYDNYRTFPILMNKTLIFGVLTKSLDNGKEANKLSFIQIPQNLPRFFEIDTDEALIFVPIEEIIRWKIHKLYRNVEIVSASLFRLTRNSDISVEESDDMEEDFIDEVKRKLRSRKTGRVVRIEAEPTYSNEMMQLLKEKWNIDDDNIFVADRLMDFTGLFQIASHPDFSAFTSKPPLPQLPYGLDENHDNPLEYLKQRDVLLHHPYNSIEPLLQLLEKAAEDPNVLAIKMTIYRLAKNSRVTSALLKAAELGKHVSVLFELKARFDEENNIREAERLQKAGCFVIHGISRYKTHTKLLLIVRKETDRVVRYVHLSSGNYNENTARLYTDVGLLTTNELYGQDVSEFFNAITGHSQPLFYQSLITAPQDMRNKLIQLVRQEADNARQGLKSGIVIKINSLEDRHLIDELYAASQAGVLIRLIVRGICCLRPGRPGLSEHIQVRSIVGDLLEHSRIFYFQNQENPLIYAGSADAMVRSFDRRIESLFQITDASLHHQIRTILDYNLRDNANAYQMEENGKYTKVKPPADAPPFNIHRAFFQLYASGRLPETVDLFAQLQPDAPAEVKP